VLQHIRLLIFDLDYLVFDCAPLKVQALRQSLISLADAIPQNVRLPDAEDAEEGFRDRGFRWTRHLEIGLGEDNLEHLRHVYDLNERRLIEAGAGKVFAGIHEFIAKCRGMDISAVLGAEASRDYLVSVAERHQLEALFDLSLCTEEFGAGGADEMIEEIMHHAEVNPSETVVLGTRPQFFQAAHNLDVLTIGCGWGIRQHQSLAEADLVSLTLSQLYSVIQKADDLASQYS
jgi:phosphoglycolate phosphatase-like HAD superfamily hydrolase